MMCLVDQCDRPSRRAVLGAAAAVAIAACAPTRALAGVTERPVEWMNGSDRVDGHLAFARMDAPIVVVLHGNAGLPADVRGTANWLASQGFVGFAVNPTSRYPDPTKIPREILAGRGFGDQCVADARAGLAHLAQQGFKSDRLGLIGYCGGGYMGLLWGDGEFGRELDAFVGLHVGLRNRTPQGLSTSRPHGIDLYRRLAAPAQFHFGGADELTPDGDIADLKALGRELGKSLETFVYDGAEHGFAMSTDAAYRADHAKHAEQRALAFLRRTLQS